MNFRNITEDIFYVGVNDRTTERFEALWPLPYGVSYNSYIVKGMEKTALIDTVEIGEGREFLNHIYNVLGHDAKIDYLVVNHMEPDHSGGITMIKKFFPELKIVGNKQTIVMLKGFYRLTDEDCLEIGNGSTLDLGEKTLSFVLTPMVHWPETMMTYVKEDKVLFTGDAFGTFGALNGGVVDDEMETDVYISEMYRYYSNIVGKYGKAVQRALGAVGSLDFEYICSTHGPVWHSRLKEVVGIVDRLSKYESEDGVTIVYGSMYGNTAEAAEEIARRLCELGVRNIKVHNIAKASLSHVISDAFRYKGLIVGGPTYSLTLFPPLETFLNAMETREITNKVFATFGSFTWSPASVRRVCEFADRNHLDIVDSVEFKHSMNDDNHAAVNRLASAFVEKLKKA